MASLPFVQSRINGMKIPLLPGQAGIMHRFRNPENQLVISHATEHGRIDTDERMVLDSPAPNEVPTAPARKGGVKASAAPTLGAVQAAPAADPQPAAGTPQGVTL